MANDAEFLNFPDRLFCSRAIYFSLKPAHRSAKARENIVANYSVVTALSSVGLTLIATAFLGLICYGRGPEARTPKTSPRNHMSENVFQGIKQYPLHLLVFTPNNKCFM